MRKLMTCYMDKVTDVDSEMIFSSMLTVIVMICLLAPFSADALVWGENTIGSGGKSVPIADFDGDGDVDVLGSNNQNVIWAENTDGSGTSWSEHTVSEFSGNFKYVEDVDGDGDIDIIGTGSSEIVWWENADGIGTTWIEHIIEEAFLHPTALSAADMDGDGDIDVIICKTINYCGWWENADGIGTVWAEHSIDNLGESRFLNPVDFDGDGDIDLHGANEYTGQIMWIENLDGTGNVWTSHPVASAVVPTSGYVIDLDGDSDFDVLSSGFYSGIYWFENHDGTGTEWYWHLIEADGHGVHGADLDSDGDMDVLGSVEHKTCWFENTDGTGLSLTRHTIAKGGRRLFNTMSCGTADLNTDGRIDVVGIKKHDGLVVWWEQTTIMDVAAVTLTPTSSTIVPADGGVITFDVSLLSQLQSPIYRVRLLTSATLPNGEILRPLFAQNFSMDPFMDVTVTSLSQEIPANFPAGEYQFKVYVGLRDFNTEYIEDSFTATKEGDLRTTESRNNPNDRFAGSGSMFTWDYLAAETPFPAEVKLHAAYPNPFNPATTISVSLPESADLAVSVYNVNCQKVATLADGQISAGQHSFVFDASGLASGLYFIHATVPGHLDQVQKVMLVR